MLTPISIVVRASSEHKYSISANHEDSVLDLKNKIALQDETPPERVRLVYSGRVLKDTNTLGSYKIADGHTIHLVRRPYIVSPLSAPPAETASASSIPMLTSSPTAATTNATPAATSDADHIALLFLLVASNPDMRSFPSPWAHTVRSNSDPSSQGGGAPGRFSNTGSRDTMNPAIMTQMMQDPTFAQYMSSMLQNPRIIESMLALNPFLQAMGPQAGEILRSRQFQTMISDPETLRRVAQAGSQMGCPGGMGGANTAESMSRTSSTWPGAEPSMGSPTSSAARAATTPTAFNQSAVCEGSAPSSRVGANNSPASHLMENYWAQQVGALRGSLNMALPSAMKQEPVGFEERYQVELKKLNEMGFWDAAKNVRALVASSGSLNGAIELLFSGAV
ncbi:hypothetical protein BGZ68_007881 [Mortierella alpina]|nr:hypothetical protein BGZ68_007881 [Mortierella alpina]